MASPQDPSDRSPANPVVSSSDPTPPPERSEINVNGGDAKGKKPAWNVHSNGSVEAGPVMGGTSWPSLSHSTKSSPKLKDLSNGILSVPPGPAIASPQSKTGMANSNGNPTSNRSPPTRQKSMKQTGGGGSGSASCELSSPLARQEPSPKTLHNNSSNDHNNTNNDSEQVSKVGTFLSQPHGVNEHHRSYSRRGNNGGGASHYEHLRDHDRGNNGGGASHYEHRRDHDRGNKGGGGSHYEHRRDHDRGNNERNHRSFGNRDINLHQRGPRSYFRPLVPVSAPFIAPIPPPIRPFGSPMGYSNLPFPVYYVATHPPPQHLRGVPFPSHPTMLFPPLDPLRAKLLKQIDYYFSSENLCKDIYLRKNMDDQGWVPISLIAGFNKVVDITQVNDRTTNTQYILTTMPLSTLVEVQMQDEKIRRRYDWMKWPSISGQQSPASTSYDALSAHMQAVGLEDTNHNSIRLRSEMSRSASGNLAGGFNGNGNDPGNAKSLLRNDTI